MEIKRREMTDEMIAAKESELIDQIKELLEENRERFIAIGYELVLQPQRKTDDEYSFHVLDLDTPRKYEIGYSSQARISVRKPKDAPLAEDNSIEEEVLEDAERLGIDGDDSGEAVEEENNEETSFTDEETEQMENDRVLEESEDELKRTAAFTIVMLARVYKTFFREMVSIPDNLDSVKEDLDEFYEKLQEEKQKELSEVAKNTESDEI
ncbi:MAG: hypothetical protein K6F14_07655 [Clostridiales bacterium]|nr:hypothetical protein [Clostridiales bacterium]